MSGEVVTLWRDDEATFVTAPGLPPPGWYDDGSGAQRWWNGEAWGPYAPVHQSTALAILSHLGIFLGGFIIPLIAYVTSDKDPFTRAHGREALNFQITLMFFWIGGFVLLFVPLIATSTGPNHHIDAAGGVLFVVFGIILFAAWITAIVFSIRGAIRASRGEAYRYPISIRLVGRNEAAAEEARAHAIGAR